MKFLFTATDFGGMGGITASLKNLSNELIARGNEVIWMRLPRDIRFSVEINPKIKIIELNGLARLWNIGIGDFKSARGLKKILLLFVGISKKILSRLGLWEKVIFAGTAKIECDVAIAYRQSKICYYLIKNKTTAKRTIAFIHSEVDENSLAWAPYLKNIDRIACVSNAWSKAFAEHYPQYKNKVATVYNLFDAEAVKKKAEEKNPYPDDDTFRIVTVARLEKNQKRVDKIPEVLNEVLSKSQRKVHWYVVGEGPDRELLEENIKKYNVQDNITLVGAKKNPYPYIKNADLFVLMSTWESYGMVLVESLIVGTPILSTEYPAVHEIVDDGRNGIITENNTVAVVEGVCGVLSNQALYDRLKITCENYRYDKSLGAEQFLNLCR